MTAAALLLALVTLGRLGELWLARRNTAALLGRGAVEIAPRHYPEIVAMHAAWLMALWAYSAGQTANPLWLAVFLGLQAARVQARGQYTIGRKADGQRQLIRCPDRRRPQRQGKGQIDGLTD